MLTTFTPFWNGVEQLSFSLLSLSVKNRKDTDVDPSSKETEVYAVVHRAGGFGPYRRSSQSQREGKNAILLCKFDREDERDWFELVLESPRSIRRSAGPKEQVRPLAFPAQLEEHWRVEAGFPLDWWCN